MRHSKHVSAFLLASFLLPINSIAAVSLSSEQDKISYSIGVDIGRNFRSQNIALTSDPFSEGVKHGLSTDKTLMTDEEMKNTLVSFQQKIIDERTKLIAALSEKNKKEGKDFLAKNKKRKDVKTLPSGLQYRVITEGTGTSPVVSDLVTTNYRGTLIDGTEFDSSYKRGEPVQFPVEAVIPGWTEALQLMKPGAKWELFVPPELAYGEQGAGRVIGPNATLIFDVELLKVEKPKAKEANKAKS